ncbi:MAG: hypothetical protein P1P88_09975 [Bacteroidales bacterium]|nr:hypothetical protein [Bacteroidales bacterium]
MNQFRLISCILTGSFSQMAGGSERSDNMNNLAASEGSARVYWSVTTQHCHSSISKPNIFNRQLLHLSATTACTSP